MSLTGRLGTPESEAARLMPGGPPVAVTMALLATVTLSEASAGAYLNDTLTASVALSEASATMRLTSAAGA